MSENWQGWPEETVIDGEVYSAKARVLIAAAKAYVDRGKWVQYDDTYLDKGVSKCYYRCTWGDDHEPERATAQHFLYTNCAMFMNNLIWEAFDYDIRSFFTGGFVNREDIRVFHYVPDGRETEEEKAALCRKVSELLVPGDMLVYRYGKNNNGHIVLYIGGGRIIHSTGKNYNYDEALEMEEETGSIQYGVLAESEYQPGNRRYLPDMERFAILRPLKLINHIPEKSLNRFYRLQGIRASLLCSHPEGISANAGETVTYTAELHCCSEASVSVQIQCAVPEGTVLTDEGGSQCFEGRDLEWNIELQPGETKEVSFAVTIESGLLEGTIVRAPEASVNGVKLFCNDIEIRRTLLSKEQTEIDRKLRSFAGSFACGTKIADEVYRLVFGKGIGLDTDEELYNYTYSGDVIKEIRPEAWMAVNKLYGGRKVRTVEYMSGRAQMLREEMFLPGDVLLMCPDPEVKARKVYLVLSGGQLLEACGEGARILDKEASALCLAAALGQYAFAVLRPSYML